MFDEDELQEQFSDLEFYVAWSTRYHQSREWFYEKIDMIMDSTSAFLTAASVLTLLGKMIVQATATGTLLATTLVTAEVVTAGALAAATFLSIARRGFRIQEKMQRHQTIAGQLGDIRQEISTLDQYNERDLRRLKGRYAAIQKSSPSTLDLLSDVCFNKTVVELERNPDAIVPLGRFSWLKRVFAHFGNFGYSPPPTKRILSGDMATRIT